MRSAIPSKRLKQRLNVRGRNRRVAVPSGNVAEDQEIPVEQIHRGLLAAPAAGHDPAQVTGHAWRSSSDRLSRSEPTRCIPSRLPSHRSVKAFEVGGRGALRLISRISAGPSTVPPVWAAPLQQRSAAARVRGRPSPSIESPGIGSPAARFQRARLSSPAAGLLLAQHVHVLLP